MMNLKKMELVKKKSMIIIKNTKVTKLQILIKNNIENHN
jgi:hypothetical protein